MSQMEVDELEEQVEDMRRMVKDLADTREELSDKLEKSLTYVELIEFMEYLSDNYNRIDKGLYQHKSETSGFQLLQRYDWQILKEFKNTLR